MQGSRKNPFEIFGLTPEIAHRLGEEDLFALVKSIYRSLSKVYHPDRSASKTLKTRRENALRSVELNLAYEQLNRDKSPDSFRRCHKVYAARQGRGLRKKIGILENQIRQQETEKAELADGYMEYLIRGLPWQSNGESAGPMAPAPTNLKLGLNDVAIGQNVRTMSWNLGSNYKEIVFDALGAMFYRPVGRGKPFPVNFIHIMGCIEMGRIDLLPLLNRVPPKTGLFRQAALDSRYGIDGAPLQVLNTMSLDKFKRHCLPLLRPELSERAYLFSIHRPVMEEERSVSIEGVIVRITRL